MKKQKWSVGFALCFLCALCLLVTVGTVKGEGTGAATPSAPTGYLENILFEKMAGKERVTIMASRQAGVQVEKLAGKSIAVKMDDMFVPTDLRKPLGEGALNNVIRALPAQAGTVGKQTVSVVIELRESVPYNVRQEGNLVVIDFNVAALPAAASPSAQVVGISTKSPLPPFAKGGVDERISPTAPVTGSSAPPAQVVTGTGTSTSHAPAVSGGAPDGKQPAAAVTDKNAGTPLATGGCPPAAGQTNNCITVDFQDADIRGVLRLLAEQGNVNIVASPDIKGNVTVRMENVPWDQVLATVLDINGLTQKRTGDVISVMTTERAKKDEADRVASVQSRQKEEDAAKKTEQEKLVESGKLRQISIEAKILEATDTFTRNLGVQWGYGSTSTVFSGNYPLGVIAGTNPSGIIDSTTTPPAVTTLSSGLAMTRGALAVNFPVNAFAPALGIVLGSAYSVFSAQISAMEKTGQNKLISSPRVVTMDGESATIEQGEEIPVVTPASANNPATTTYKPAVLKLTVKPRITPDGKISMEISAKNDYPVKAEKDAQGNMPIYTNKVDSKVVISNGDTIIIGGIMKTEEAKGETGIPWLSKIPLIGWLFKVQTLDQNKRELYVFVTPRIIQQAEDTGRARRP